MNEPITPYDEVPYESQAFPQTHPDRLATVATLLGMQPVPVERCRVLELGCGMGDNLIPMAAGLPNSSFLGIDLSARQVAAGRDTIRALSLSNLELRRANILELNGDLGLFDYIICHGVYSWVPEAVRNQILELCSRQLSEHGVGYVSYNTYPGWHFRGLIRDMVHYHAIQFHEPHVKIQQARNLLAFLAKSVSGSSKPYSLLLAAEFERMRQSRDSYLFHEHLEEVNEPCYFYDFVEQLERHGLRYVGEADLGTMLPDNFPPEIANVLQMLSADHIHLEQYMDFLRNRTFRQSLICRRNVSLNYTLRPEIARPFFVASRARPSAAQPNLHSNEYERFQTPEGEAITLNHPLTKAAMATLSEISPRFVSVPKLCHMARERLGWPHATEAVGDGPDVTTIGKALLTAYASTTNGLVEFRLTQPEFVAEACERPVASALARYMATRGNRATNQRHETIVLDEFQRQLVMRLDGTRDRTALLAELSGLFDSGQLVVHNNGQRVDRNAIDLPALLDERLSHIAHAAILTA